MEELALKLPYPPSVNRYYRHVGFRVLISREGRIYRQKVVDLLKPYNLEPVDCPLCLEVDFYPPDRRKRDLDNVGGKALLDSLKFAGVYEDDSIVKKLILTMHSEVVRNGLCYVIIKEFSE